MLVGVSQREGGHDEGRPLGDELNRLDGDVRRGIHPGPEVVPVRPSLNRLHLAQTQVAPRALVPRLEGVLLVGYRSVRKAGRSGRPEPGELGQPHRRDLEALADEGFLRAAVGVAHDVLGDLPTGLLRPCAVPLSQPVSEQKPSSLPADGYHDAGGVAIQGDDCPTTAFP